MKIRLAVRFALLALMFLFVVAPKNADAAVCFQDVRSWEAVKAKLPRFMQSGEVYAVHEDGFMVGGVAITQAGAQFRIEAHGHHVFAGTINESDIIRQICVDGTKIHAELVSGRADDLNIESKGVSIKGYTFTFTSRAGYEDVLSRVPKFVEELLAQQVR